MLVIRLLRLCLVEIPKKNDRNPGNLKSNPHHPAVWPRNCPPRVTVRVSPNPANDYTAELQRIWYQKMAPYFEAVVDPPFSKAPILLDIPAVRISVLLMAKNPAFTHSPVGLWEVIYHYLPGFKKGSQVVGLGSSEAPAVVNWWLRVVTSPFRPLIPPQMMMGGDDRITWFWKNNMENRWF